MHPPPRHIEPVRFARRSRESASLRRLLPSASFVGCADIRVGDVAERAEDCRPGVLFAPRPEALSNDPAITLRAIRNGAAALLVARPMVGLPVPQCVVSNVPRAYGRLCAALCGDPPRRVHCAGLIGSDHSSFAISLVQAILAENDQEAGVAATSGWTGADGFDESAPPARSAKDFWSWMSRIAGQGARFALLELSSDAVDLDWFAPSDFATVAVADLGPAGTGPFQRTVKDATHCLRALELPRPGGTVVINEDDPRLGMIRPRIPDHLNTSTYGLERPGQITASGIVRQSEGTRMVLTIRGRSIELLAPFDAQHQVSGCLLAVAIADALGLTPEEIVAGLEAARHPVGAQPVIS